MFHSSRGAPRGPDTGQQARQAAVRSRLPEHCLACAARKVCLHHAYASGAAGPDLVSERHIAPGAVLFRAGESARNLYTVRSGAFKTIVLSTRGEEKVTGFSLPGDLLGTDAITATGHACDAVALEASVVCSVRFPALEQRSLADPAFQQRLFRALSIERSRHQGLLLLLGGMRAEERLAAFLLILSQRYARLGCDAERFALHMPRYDIANHLGLSAATVSRLLTRFRRQGLITLHERRIELTDRCRLRGMVAYSVEERIAAEPLPEQRGA